MNRAFFVMKLVLRTGDLSEHKHLLELEVRVQVNVNDQFIAV